MTMVTQVMTVTPEMASAWLQKNVVNRAVRKNRVAYFRKQLRNGTFALHHHGIAFNLDMQLLDGQHRLIAISEEGVAAQCNVTTGLELARAIDLKVDRSTPRRMSDLMNAHKGHCEVASFIAKLIHGSLHDENDASVILEIYGDQITALFAACNTSRRAKSSASSRSAVVLNMARYPDQQDVIASQYRNYIILEDLVGMWPSIGSLIKQDATNTLGSSTSGALELFCKTYLAFNPTRRELQKVICRDVSAILDEARASIRERVAQTTE